MTEQPEALRLADALTKHLGGNTATQAAAELRRLHEENAQIKGLNDDLYTQGVAFVARIAEQEAVMRQALEAWAIYFDAYPHMQKGYVIDAITAMRERLAQPEPQAPRPDYRDWDYQDQLDEQEKSAQSPLDRMAENARELGLDYEPVQEPEYEQALMDAITGGTGVVLGGKRIDPASIYKEPEQEPVAWKDRTYGNLHHHDFGNSIPLYTTPPRREWVGLTDEEWAALWEEFAWESELTIEEQFQKEMTKKHGKGHYYMGAEEFWNRQKDVIQKLVNAKLKEKNV